MVDEDFVQEEYVPKEGYTESIKFSDDFFTSKSTSEASVAPKTARRKVPQNVIIEEAPAQEILVEKEQPHHKREAPKKIIHKHNVEKKASVPKKVIKESTEKQKKLSVEKVVEPKIVKKEGQGLKSSDFRIKPSLIAAGLALIVIILLVLLILNLDRIFPDEGKPVAIVNGQVITTKDIENTQKTIPALYRNIITDEEILNQTIITTLLLQKAQQEGITVTDLEVENFIDKTIAAAQISKNQYKSFLKEQNLSYSDMIIFYKTHLTIEKLLQNTAYKDINITKDQIVDFYENASSMLDNISLEEVESQIEAYLLQQAKADALAAYVDTLMEQSEIKMLNQNNALNSASSSNASIGDKTEYADCATLNNLDKNSVIFIYSDSCPHCLRMKPIVNDLESQNYKFIWVSAADNNMRNIMNKCYSDILAGGVPQFICARNGETLVGEQSQEELQQFTANCNQ